MWDVPVWKAHVRLNSLFEDGVATESQQMVDGFHVSYYSINLDSTPR
jgi:hypothetical protein